MFERRLTPRISLGDVVVQCFSYETQTIPTCEGRIMNLGSEGMKLETEEAANLALDDDIFLSFILPDASRFIKKKARVIWQAKGSQTIFGLYFPDQVPEEFRRLKSFLALRNPARG